jgi:RNA polymerase sigma-70 factor (ECF subfamily)
MEEFDTDQTAERLGSTPGAVKTRLHRARQALRSLLEPVLRPGEGRRDRAEV